LDMIGLVKKWEECLHSLYHGEMVDPKWEGQHVRFRRFLISATRALQEYEMAKANGPEA
jgi:hypothetical protein